MNDSKNCPIISLKKTFIIHSPLYFKYAIKSALKRKPFSGYDLTSGYVSELTLSETSFLLGYFEFLLKHYYFLC